MPFIWLFGKASQLLPQRHTFPQDWTQVTANSAVNKHDNILYVGSAETRHTNPSFMVFYIYCCLSWFLNIFCFFQHSKDSKMSISIILDSRLSHSRSILTLGDAILLVTGVGWEMLRQTAEVERWDRSLSSWSASGLCTWQQINASLHSVSRTTVNPGNGQFNVNKSNRTGWRHAGTFPLVWR